MSTHDQAELDAGIREAETLVLMLRTWPSEGDELLEALSRLGARGRVDRLKGFCRALQREISSTTQKKRQPEEAAEKSKVAKWTLSLNGRKS